MVLSLLPDVRTGVVLGDFRTRGLEETRRVCRIRTGILQDSWLKARCRIFPSVLLKDERSHSVPFNVLTIVVCREHLDS